MFALSSAALLSFVLLAAPAAASGHSPLPVCESGTRQLELTADTPRPVHEVCVRPGLSSSFLFNVKLARVELPGRERFRVIEDETGFLLVPSRTLKDGERVRMTVHFQDGAALASITFLLVVHPAEAERQVEVVLQPRTVTSYREGEQRALEEVHQCHQEKARLQTQCAGQVGLRGLFAQGLMGEQGVPSKDIRESISARPGNTLTPSEAHSYRADTERTQGGHKVVRLAVVQELQNNGKTPWTPAGAVLMGPQGEEWKALGVWPLKPIAPGRRRRVVVEVECTEEEARGTFTLKLWSQERGGTGELFDGVTFP
ncbi:DUF2381 family protein [Archangium sp.]|uniref:DUF2381 family protein n=1 Tax=Archangium sp. TaxID=1872627 RepID=UPI00286A7385|nr:DUF2381 family protein [Archangium sp.]